MHYKTSTPSIGIQLWTVREEIRKDLSGTLNRLAEMGFGGIELWFENDPDPDTLKAMTDAAGLQIIGAHTEFPDLRDCFEETAEYHKACGNRDLIIPIIPDELRQSENAWKQRVHDILAIAQRCRDEGFRLTYHNHEMEYLDQIDGREVCEVMFESIPAPLLDIELDTFFLEDTGRNPADYIRKYADRSRLLHLKDRHPQRDQYLNSEVGSGTIKWPEVFSAAAKAGIEWYIVEQDCDEFPVWDSLTMSMEFIRRSFPN